MHGEKTTVAAGAHMGDSCFINQVDLYLCVGQLDSDDPRLDTAQRMANLYKRVS